MGYTHFYMCKTFDSTTLSSAASTKILKTLTEIDLAEGTTRSEIVYGVCQKTPDLKYLEVVIPEFNKKLSKITQADRKLAAEILTFVEPKEQCSIFSACFNALNSPKKEWNEASSHFTHNILM